MTVRAGVADGVQGPDVAARIDKALAPLRAELPSGYRVEIGGDSEESAKSQASIFKMMPLMAFLMVLFLMLQLQSFSKLALVMLTAPLGLIGVSLFLLAFNQPFGFVSLLGVIALAGMIMRNSVILVDQIDQDIAAGHSAWDAVVDATVRRARPILLTAGTAIFAMIPLSRSVFWGPMAVALMGGLGQDIGVPYGWLMRNCVTLHGQWMYPRDAIGRMIGLVRAGLVKLDEVEVTTFALDDATAAIDHAAANAGPFKVTAICP